MPRAPPLSPLSPTRSPRPVRARAQIAPVTSARPRIPLPLLTPLQPPPPCARALTAPTRGSASLPRSSLPAPCLVLARLCVPPREPRPPLPPACLATPACALLRVAAPVVAGSQAAASATLMAARPPRSDLPRAHPQAPPPSRAYLCWRRPLQPTAVVAPTAPATAAPRRSSPAWPRPPAAGTQPPAGPATFAAAGALPCPAPGWVRPRPGTRTRMPVPAPICPLGL
nr:translation initiation factor IF-2-like [Aegilops tauschii subsp. strangulata]